MSMTEPDPKSAEEELISYLKPEDEEYLEHYGWKRVKPEPPKPEPPKLVVPPKPVLTVADRQVLNGLRTPNEVRAYNELESSRKAERIDATTFGSRVRNTLPGMLGDPERGPEYWQRLARDTDDLTERRCYLQKARALQNDIITERSRVRTVTEQMGRDHASGLIAGLTTSLSPSQPSELVPFSSRTQIHRGAREVVHSSQELIRDARGIQRNLDRLQQELTRAQRTNLERAQFWRRMRSFIGVNTLVSVALMFLAYSFWQQNYDQDTQQQAQQQNQRCSMYATMLSTYAPSTRSGQDLLNYNASYAQMSVAYRELRCP
jgi:hypothetical protein